MHREPHVGRNTGRSGIERPAREQREGRTPRPRDPDPHRQATYHPWARAQNGVEHVRRREQVPGQAAGEDRDLGGLAVPSLAQRQEVGGGEERPFGGDVLAVDTAAEVEIVSAAAAAADRTVSGALIAGGGGTFVRGGGGVSP